MAPMTKTWWRGQHLARPRRRRGLSQAALAQRMGSHVMSISKLERNERVPSVVTLQRLANALGVPLTALLS